MPQNRPPYSDSQLRELLNARAELERRQELRITAGPRESDHLVYTAQWTPLEMQQVLNAQIEPSPELAQGMRRTTLTNSAQDQADPMQRKLPNWALPFGRRSFPSHQGHGLLESFLVSRTPSVLSGNKKRLCNT